MINFKLIKKTFFLLLFTAVTFYTYVLINSFKNSPDIKDIGTINISDITFSQPIKRPDTLVSTMKKIILNIN